LGSAAAEAVTVFGPGLDPRVQLPLVATPFASVTGLAPAIVPPPVATANVTATPGTGTPAGSVIRTASGTGTFEVITADWLAPANATMLDGTGGTVVAVNVIGLPVTPDSEATSV
jgi:hypothetical protein